MDEEITLSGDFPPEKEPAPIRTKPLSEAYWYTLFLKEFCNNDPKDTLVSLKPSPLRWAGYFLSSMKLNQTGGLDFSKKCVRENKEILGENLTSVEELIFEGDVDTTRFQIERLKDMTPKEGEEKKPYYIQQKDVKDNLGVLHYAILTRNNPMVQMLLQNDAIALINRNDYITGFTPLHIGLFVQCQDILWTLFKVGAEPSVEDKFEATIFDYAQLLGNIPQPYQKNKNQITFKYFDIEKKSLIIWDVPKFEEELKVTYTPYFRCDLTYIVELMLSGFSIGEKDQAFRDKYSRLMEESSGDQNLILAKISDKVGYGVFAAKSFAEGDYIVRYGGLFMKQVKSESHAYCMSSGVESIVLNSLHFRNLGGIINHSKNFNAESKCIFTKGVEQAIIVATKEIKKGEQIFIDYSESYFQSTNYVFEELSKNEEFPTRIPEQWLN